MRLSEKIGVLGEKFGERGEKKNRRHANVYDEVGR